MQQITTKDGIVITGIPDDMATNDQRLKDMVASMRAAGTKSANFGGVSEQAAEQPITEDPLQYVQTQEQKNALFKNMGDNAQVALRGVVGGVTSPVSMVGDPLMMLVNKLLPEGQKKLSVSQGIQQLLTNAGVKEAETESQKIMQAAVSGYTGGFSSSVLGKLASKAPGAIGTIGKVMATDPMSQMVGGAASEATSEVARQQGASPLAQFGLGMAAGVGAGGINALRKDPLTPGVVSEAKEAGINLLTEDVFPPKTAIGKSFQIGGEMMPVIGTGGKRAAQQAQRTKAVEKIINEYSAFDLRTITSNVTSDIIEKNAADLNKYGELTNDVVERLSKTGKPVSVTNTINKIDEQLADLYKSDLDSSKDIIKKLEGWKRSLQGTDGKDLKVINDVREDMGKAFTAKETAEINDKAQQIIKSLYAPIKEDMGTYIKSVGEAKDYTQWMVANKELTKIFDELDLKVFKNVLDNGTVTPELSERLLFSSNRSDVAALYRNLTEEGRAMARAAVIAKAAQKSGDNLDPNKFATEIGKMGDQTGILFSGDELKQIKGLTKMLNMTRRSQEAAASPKNGFQALMGLGLFGAGYAAEKFGKAVTENLIPTAIGSGIALTPRIYNSKPVRNILINLSQLKDDTPEAKALLATLMTTIEAQNQKMQGDTTPVKKEREQYYMPN